MKKEPMILLSAAWMLLASASLSNASTVEVVGGETPITVHGPGAMCGRSGKTNSECLIRINGMPACKFDEDGEVTNGNDFIFRPRSPNLSFVANGMGFYLLRHLKYGVETLL